MKPILITAFLTGILPFSCNDQAEQKPKAPSAETVAQYTKFISHKWKLDTAHFHREMQAYADSVVRVARTLKPGSEQSIAELMEDRIPGWIEGMGDDRQELFPDGRRISTLDGAPGEARYAFSKGLDSLYFQTFKGETMESFELAPISDTSFTVIRTLIIPTIDKSPENRKLYKARYKYVLE